MLLFLFLIIILYSIFVFGNIKTRKISNNTKIDIDAYLYINLRDRKDRKIQIENEFKKSGLEKSKIFRIDAVYDKWNGHIGCVKSHIKALEFAKSKKFKNIIVFEDDFIFTKNKNYINNCINSIDFDWDVIQLSSSYKKTRKYNKKFEKAIWIMSSSGYIINNNFYDKLLKNFKESLEKMEKEMETYDYSNGKKKETNNALDQHWGSLQKNSKWYIFEPPVGKQSDSSSSIMNDVDSNMNVPNNCHFIFGLKEQTEEFIFCYYIAVYSAYLINNPDIIYFYYHYEPFGKWWDKLIKIPSIKLIKIDIPTHIGNKKLKKTAHKADWVRMNILFNKGGIYLDIDTICIKPWNHLLNKDVVLCKEVPSGICNAIMITKPKSKFFKLWLDEYENHFNPDGWREASIELPETLSKKYPNLLTVKEPDVFFLPNYTETHKIFVNDNEIPSNLISLHLWESFSLKYMNNINDWSWAYKNFNTMYGKMLLNLKRYLIQDYKNNNNICILSNIIGKEYTNKCSYGTLSKEFYCYKNNYDLIMGSDKDYEKIIHDNKRFGWLKVYKLLEILNDYDYIFVSDADVSIMNNNLKLESIINRFMDNNTLMLITKDHNGINSGNFIVKGKNKLIYKYISLWRDNLQNKYNYIGGQDQPSLINIILNTNFRKYVKIIDQSIINSYPDIPINRNSKIYKPNDLLIHYAGYSWHNRDFSNDMKDNFFNLLKKESNL